MYSIECPLPALKKLKESGLDKKILKAKDKWQNVLFGMWFSGEFSDVFDEAREKLDSAISSSEKAMYNSLLDLEAEIEKDDYLNKKDGLVNYPSALAYLAIGRDLLKFSKYGFYTRRQLEETITSFCFSDQLDRRDACTWINGNYKNIIKQTDHADLDVTQKDISGRHYVEETLFGPVEVFDTIKEGTGKGIGGDQNWTMFLLSILKYAEAIGKKRMYEIVNWKKVIEEVGAKGSNTAEAMFGGKLESFIFDRELLVDGKEPESFPLRTENAIPYVNAGKLYFLREDSNGKIKFDYRLLHGKYSEAAVFDESDLPDLLRGTYRFYARDRSEIPQMLEMFLKE